MKVLRNLLIAVVLTSAQSFSAHAEDASDYTNRFFDLVVSNDQGALREFDLGLTEAQAGLVLQAVTSLQDTASGAPLGYSLVEDWRLTETLHRLYYTLNYREGVVGLAIAVYRVGDKWIVVDYRQYSTILEFFDALR